MARVIRRTSIIAALAACLVALSGGSAQANKQTIGSSLTAPGFAPSLFAASATVTNYVLPAPATGVSPYTGTIRSWSLIGSGGPFVPRVLRVTSGFSLTGVSTGSPVNATAPNVVNGPFTVNLPIKAGEFFGVDATNGSSISTAATAGSTYLYFAPPLGNGALGRTATNTVAAEEAIQAVITYCVVPKLKGKTGKEARNALTAADCDIGDVEKSNKRKPVKKVLSQSVKAGTQISDTQPVDFKISKKTKS